MSIDKQSIQEKLSKLSEITKLLEQYKKDPKEDFLLDKTVNSAAQFNLMLGIEVVTDIGHHILAQIYHVHPKEYADIIGLLGQYQVVPEDFAKQNVPMAKFRNLIVHHYYKLDMNQVYDYTQTAPDIFRQFAKYFIEFLEKEN